MTCRKHQLRSSGGKVGGIVDGYWATRHHSFFFIMDQHKRCRTTARDSDELRPHARCWRQGYGSIQEVFKQRTKRRWRLQSIPPAMREGKLQTSLPALEVRLMGHEEGDFLNWKDDIKTNKTLRRWRRVLQSGWTFSKGVCHLRDNRGKACCYFSWQTPQHQN